MNGIDTLPFVSHGYQRRRHVVRVTLATHKQESMVFE
jgi:hypothetical protein